MNVSSIFVLPSLYEGLAVVLEEARDCGLRCLASDTIPSEVDIGGMKFYSLKNGVASWAKKCIQYISKNININFDKLEKLDIKNYVNQIYELYGGNKNEKI